LNLKENGVYKVRLNATRTFITVLGLMMSTSVRLGKSGLKVSKIILGCMSFGTSKWEGSPWVLDEEESLKVIKAAWDSGINTWVSKTGPATFTNHVLGGRCLATPDANHLQDTADTYSNGKSEIILGKAMKKYNIPRSKVVIMTKIFNPVMDDDSRPPSVNDGPLVNQMGLSRKHVFEAVDRCLERLGTDYIGMSLSIIPRILAKHGSQAKHAPRSFIT
jgi:predicted oxidoreductase